MAKMVNICEKSEEESISGSGTVESSLSFSDVKTYNIQTHGYHNNIKFPLSTVIQSENELENYYKVFENEYHKMDEVKQCLGGITNVFFEKNTLLVCSTHATSGSHRYRIQDVNVVNGKVNIKISHTSPQVCTCDMAEWHLITVIPNGKLKNVDYKNFNVKIVTNE
ncbi:unnamed protein product [Didymodactylos carnosus]|uniref:Uncharacterized protein n=1 Tax=Didymodactylos carnosus TaxID=1234261 RepID=A0A815XBE8_9BILA|nr:unnamed protein product [Didymodactylos carnosus]CAF4416582.1 unnamed protein product [Didymodactylos carnosus]